MSIKNIYEYIKENHPLLTKVTKSEYASSFIEGKIYLNPIQLYQTIENKGNEMTRDIYEGANHAVQSSEFDFLVSPNDPDLKIPSSSVIGAVWGGFEKNKNCRIFCMYNIEVDFNTKCIEPIDKRILDFGDTFVLVTNAIEFVRRIEAGVNKIHEKLDGPAIFQGVEYIDPMKHSGFVGPFRKEENYRWQNEYRLCLKFKGQDTGPVILDIGDISDITLSGKTEKLLNGIKFAGENQLYIPG